MTYCIDVVQIVLQYEGEIAVDQEDESSRKERGRYSSNSITVVKLITGTCGKSGNTRTGTRLLLTVCCMNVWRTMCLMLGRNTSRCHQKLVTHK